MCVLASQSERGKGERKGRGGENESKIKRERGI